MSPTSQPMPPGLLEEWHLACLISLVLTKRGAFLLHQLPGTPKGQLKDSPSSPPWTNLRYRLLTRSGPTQMGRWKTTQKHTLKAGVLKELVAQPSFLLTIRKEWALLLCNKLIFRGGASAQDLTAPSRCWAARGMVLVGLTRAPSVCPKCGSLI